jgi:hypothetical protein
MNTAIALSQKTRNTLRAAFGDEAPINDQIAFVNHLATILAEAGASEITPQAVCAAAERVLDSTKAMAQVLEDQQKMQELVDVVYTRIKCR